MRLAYVRGTLTLHQAIEGLGGKRLVVLEPVVMENLRARNGKGGGKQLIAVDQLGANVGQMVAFTEGAEATNPFWPDVFAIDAYCSLIVDTVDVQP